MKIVAYAAFLALVFALPVKAVPYKDIFPDHARASEDAQTIMESLDYKRGEIKVVGAPASLIVPEGFYYLDKTDARRVLVDLWGNPPDATEGVLGMIFPAQFDPADDRNWGSVVRYHNDGYVSDADAATTDYNALLQDLKDATREGNEERVKQNYEPITLIGWASPPLYDKDNHAMHWARELMFGNDGATTHTLNYSVRILGREGVFQFDFIATMNELADVKAAIPAVTKLVKFDTGKGYKDYAEGDKLAAYGMAGMIAAGAGAKIAAKAGILALGLAFLKKGAFLVVVAAGALGRFFKGLFSRNRTPSA